MRNNNNTKVNGTFKPNTFIVILNDKEEIDITPKAGNEWNGKDVHSHLNLLGWNGDTKNYFVMGGYVQLNWENADGSPVHVTMSPDLFDLLIEDCTGKEGNTRFNGFDSVDDHEFVLDRLLVALSTACPLGDLNGYTDTIAVYQEKNGISVNLDEDEYHIESLSDYRKYAKDLVATLRSGETDDELHSFGYGVFDRNDYNPLTNEVKVSYDGGVWRVKVTEEDFLKEYVDEALNSVVEKFADDNASSINDWFYEE